MHPIVLSLAGACFTILLGVSVSLVIRAASGTNRILALDTASFILVALLSLFAAATGSAYYLDAALVLALLSFVGTVAAARYLGEDRVFS
jgi:multicomponent Na+:H+ antiporter subunit F